MLFVCINVIMNCGCKSKAFYLHLIYKHDIPLKLTIAKAIAFRKQRFHGLIESFLVIYKDIKSAYNECAFDE